MSKINYEVNPKLKHLTEDQLNELIRRYYNNEKTTALIEEYKIDTISTKLYTLFPPEICEDTLCSNCNTAMIVDRKSRSGYSSKPGPYCPLCGHTGKANCKCTSCSEKREEERLTALELKKEQERLKRELIEKTYALHNQVPIELENLTLRDRLYIGALLRLSLSEDMQYIQAVGNTGDILAPTEELANDVLQSLYHKKIILVHPNSSIAAFPEEDGDVKFPNRFYIYKVNYHLNVGESSQREKVFQYLMNPPEIANLDNIMIRSIWKEIALAECLEYLDYQMQKVNFDFNPGEKTTSIFDNFLNSFSVSQIYGIIYKGITSATRYYQENNVSKQQAANSVIGACQRFAEKASINGWELSNFRRDSNLPQTMISEFFFNKLLKIGDEGFYSAPRKL